MEIRGAFYHRRETRDEIFSLTFGANLCYTCNAKFMKKQASSFEVQCLWALRSGSAVRSGEMRPVLRGCPTLGDKFRWDSGTSVFRDGKWFISNVLRLKMFVPVLSQVGQDSLIIGKPSFGAGDGKFWYGPRYNLGKTFQRRFLNEKDTGGSARCFFAY